MSFMPPQRSIWHCLRDLEGRKISCSQGWCCKIKIQRKENPPHWFLIISKNPTQCFVTALPITSHEYQGKLNLGYPIKSEDIEDFSKSINKIPFNRNITLVLSNKPCRIPIDEMEENKDYGRLKKAIYDDIIFETKDSINRKN